MSRRSLRGAASLYRCAARLIHRHLPPGGVDDATFAFDVLQRDAFDRGGWRGVARCWWEETRALVRLACMPGPPDAAGEPVSLFRRQTTMLRHDLRDGWRSIARAPGHTALVTLMLALGIGMNTAAFSVLDALLFKSLPYADADRIVLAAEWPRTGGNWTVAPRAYLHWRKTASSFSHLEARLPVTVAVRDGDEPIEIRGARVTAGYFDLLGIRPVRGRTFIASDAEPGAPCRAVVNQRLFADRYGRAGDPGESIRLDGESCAIIGVLPRNPAFDRGAPEIYTPLALSAADTQRDGRMLTTLGRLRDGVSVDEAGTELAAIAEAFNTTRGPAGLNWTTIVLPWRDVIVRADTRRLSWILTAAVALVLLIACANVAGLLLSRAIGRQGEMAVRAALGAGRARLLRSMVVESVLLASCAGAAGLLVGSWSLRAFVALAPTGTFPGEIAPALDSRVLLFTVGATGLTGLVAGLLPAWQAGRGALTPAVAAGSRGAAGSKAGSRLQSLLLVTELAGAMMLATAASLLVASFMKLTAVAPGFDPTGVLTMRLSASPARYRDDAQVAELYRRALDAIRANPAVAHAGAATSLPLGGWLFGTRFEVEGVLQDPDRPQSAHIQHATPGYVEALGIRIVAGRSFRAADDARAPAVAMVNETFVHRFVQDGRVVGRRLRIGSAPVPAEIIGVLASVKTGGLADADLATPEIYVPHEQAPMPVLFVAVRAAAGDPQRLMPEVRAAIRSVDADLPIGGAMTMDERLGLSVRTQRFRTALFAAFAAIAVLLACLGVYAVRSRAMAGRTREMAIRLALGATPAQVVGLALDQGLRLGALGIGIGTVSSAALAGTVESWLFDTRATDPAIFALAGGALAAAVLVASWGPARRAARVDPVRTLRES